MSKTPSIREKSGIDRNRLQDLIQQREKLNAKIITTLEKALNY